MNFIVPTVDYAAIAAFGCCVAFFVKGAEQASRSRLVWGSLSVGAWVGYTGFVSPGAQSGIVSQLLLFAGLTVWETVRDRLRVRA